MLGIAQAPDHYGGAWWAICEHCTWASTHHTLLDAQAALSHHQAEAHRD